MNSLESDFRTFLGTDDGLNLIATMGLRLGYALQNSETQASFKLTGFIANKDRKLVEIKLTSKTLDGTQFSVIWEEPLNKLEGLLGRGPKDQGLPFSI